MEVDHSARIVLLPESVSSLQILPLIYGGFARSVLIADNELYELREIHGPSTYDAHPEPTLPSGEAVKSILIEGLNDPHGAVVGSPSVLNSTPFNIIYYLLWSMSEKQENYTSRFHALDDILDDCNLPSYEAVVRQKAKESLSPICDVITENGEDFYRFCPLKAFDYLEVKVRALQKLILESPGYAILGLIKAKGALLGENAPLEIQELQTLNYSIDLIFGSYLSEALKKQFLQDRGIDFSELTIYLKQQENKKKELAVIEDNMEAVVLATKLANSSLKSRNKTVKKLSKKVAVGKGALDSFFKRS